MMLALSRNIPQATASLKGGKWEKKKFQGREVFNKTLGIIGMGRIGSIVANRARGLNMHVIGYDPHLKPEVIRERGVEPADLDTLFARSHYITIHTPRTKETTHMINPETLARMQDGVFIINCARGGIIDEKALYEAIVSGKVAGAALDVFETEPPPPDHPLLALDQVICTPHLGASTREAQDNVAIAVAEQMIDYLAYGIIRNAVNVPTVSKENLVLVRPYLILAERMGSFHTQMVSEGIEEVHIEYLGDAAKMDATPITVAALKGLLTPILKDDVNYVNAPLIARERGIRVTESKSTSSDDFSNLITLSIKTKGGVNILSGTIFGKHEPRLVRLNTFRLEALPEGHLLLIHNLDSPGVIGSIGTTLGKFSINIEQMQVGQEKEKGHNIILLNTDQSISDAVLKAIRDLPHVVTAIWLEL
jgi:D-3-phosphoglycerate dehydrogenase